MKNALAFIGAAVVAFLAVGWYLGWYQISRSPTPQGKESLHVDFNPDKITSDVKKGVEKGTELVDQIRDKTKGVANSTPGPATNFFTPTTADKDKNSTTGWKPIGDK
jgi:hypothetical protein